MKCIWLALMSLIQSGRILHNVSIYAFMISEGKMFIAIEKKKFTYAVM